MINRNNRNIFAGAVVLLVLCSAACVAVAEEAPAEEPSSIITDISFAANYTVVTDYIWRGQNFSEYAGEGAEALNHQVDLSMTAETDLGSFTAGVWLEFYDDQKDMDPSSDENLQEVDYYFGYENSYEALTYGFCYTYFEFPQTSGDAKTTNEISFSLALDDSAIFGTEEAILNPSVTWNTDMDASKGNSWVEIGIEHEFAIPGLEAFTITPSVTLGIDSQFTDPEGSDTQLGNLLYGLSASYDLSDVTPEFMGVAIGGFVNYSQALDADDVLNDEFYGGLSLDLSF